MNRQIGILVSAMILATQLGSPISAAEPTSDQLREIASMLSSDDYTGLRTYLRANPGLLVEDSTLGNLLRDFLAQPNDARGIDRNLSDALRHFSSQDSDTTDSPGGGASLY
jgi:hypothetical protein